MLRVYVLDRKSWVLLSGPAYPRLPPTALSLSPFISKFYFLYGHADKCEPINVNLSLSHEKEYVTVETHCGFLLQKIWLISLLYLPLYPDKKPKDHPHPGKLIHCLYLSLREGLHKEDRKPAGVWLVEASSDFTQKTGSQLPRQTYQQARSSGEANKLWCRLLVSLKRGR